jgi:hypothetical protein
MKPFSFRDLKKSRHEGATPEPSTIEGGALKNPQVYTSNFLIETFFKTTPDHTGGVLMEKMTGSGYSLTIGPAGGLLLRIRGGDAWTEVEGKTRVNDGQWHHAIAEVDRGARTLTLYVDGKKDATAPGVDHSVSLANDGDVYVGGTPRGSWLDGSLDFLRLAQGTLADADTTIEELHAWEFDGPFLRDFSGNQPSGTGRDAGAIEGIDDIR